MDDSLRGILVATTIAGLFITAILNFIILFPQEQGVTFNDPQSASVYLTINDSADQNVDVSLTTLNNQSENAFNQWDITQGFMGSNQLKQSQTGVKTYSSNIFNTLKIIATQLFGLNSPIVYAIGVIALLSIGYIGYLVVKWIRTGS